MIKKIFVFFCIFWTVGSFIKDTYYDVNYLNISESCETGKGNADSCVKLGDLFMDGEHGAYRDKNEAKLCYNMACDMGNAEGCYKVAQLFITKQVHEDDENASNRKVKEYFGKACDRGDKRGCDYILKN